jgi:hypothetical protein
MSWMQRLRRVFAIDLRCCARCGGGPVRVIAAITQPALIARVLEHRAARDETAGGARASAESGSPGLVSSDRFVDRSHRDGDSGD